MAVPSQLDHALMGNLLTTLGLDTLEPAEQERALQAIGDLLFQKIVFRVMEVLPVELLPQFDQALRAEERTPGSALQFLQTHIPEFDALVTAEVAAFKEDATDVMNAARLQAEL